MVALLVYAASAVAFFEDTGPVSEGCPRVVLYFARGSGQSLSATERGLSTPGIQLYDDLAKRYEPGRIAGRIAAAGLAPALPGNSASRLYDYQVGGTCAAGTCGLAEWSGPGTSSFQRVGAAYEGQEVSVVCQAVGQTMTSASGQPSAIWDELGSGAFVSDLYLNTPNVGEYSSPLPHCQALAVAKP